MDFLSPKSQASICDLDHRAFQKHYDIFRNDIFEAAVKLHQNMRSSVYQYRVQRPAIDVNMDGEELLAQGWKFKDVDKWLDVTRIGHAARPICCLYPCIIREADGHGEPLTLVPPVVAVELLGSKGSASSSHVHSARPSPTHSVSSEPNTREMVRQRDQGRTHQYTDTDLARLREQGRLMEYTGAPNSSREAGVFDKFTKWVGGRSDADPKSKHRLSGRVEAARTAPASLREQRASEHGHVYVRERRSPEHGHGVSRERKGSDHDYPRERKGSDNDYPRERGTPERGSAVDDRNYPGERNSPEGYHDYAPQRRSPERYTENLRQRRSPERWLERSNTS